MSDHSTDIARRTKAIIGGSIGNLVEWFDWTIYSTFAIYFAKSFFPNGDQTAQLLNTAAVFAVGFIMRPIGAWLLGRYADQFGRKAGLTFSVLLMSAGSLLIACCPGYDTIGILAPILLVVARLIQGLSVGGEYGSSATYLSEMATPARRGFYSSFQYVTLMGGQLLALMLQLVLQQVLTEAELTAWGWRIPFFIGAACAIIALRLRQKLDETAAYQAMAKDVPTHYWRELLAHPRAIFIVVGLTLGGTVAFYTYSVYMQKFLVNTVGFNRQQSTIILTVATLFFCLLQPIVGAISDRVGRRPTLLFFGIGGTLFTIPIMNALTQTRDVYAAFALVMAALIILSGYSAVNAIVKAELFPTKIRALGVALPYAITASVFGGTAEYVALWLKQAGHETWFFAYVTGCIAISLLVYYFMADTRDTSLIQEQ